jgi:hypothetical protein
MAKKRKRAALAVKAGRLLADCEEIVRLPEPRNSSADPTYYAARIARHSELGEGWALVCFYSWTTLRRPYLGPERFASKQAVMVHLALTCHGTPSEWNAWVQAIRKGPHV